MQRDYKDSSASEKFLKSPVRSPAGSASAVSCFNGFSDFNDAFSPPRDLFATKRRFMG
jgi:hypothetical protein